MYRGNSKERSSLPDPVLFFWVSYQPRLSEHVTAEKLSVSILSATIPSHIKNHALGTFIHLHIMEVHQKLFHFRYVSSFIKIKTRTQEINCI